MHWTERLSEYQDGELAPDERAACEAHLAECEQCGGALRDLQLAISLARGDADVMPPNDLWPGILERITAERPGKAAPVAYVSDYVSGKAGRRAPRRISFTLSQLALAASLLVAVSASVAYVAAGRTTLRPSAVERPIQAVGEPLMPASPDAARANFADAQFDRAVADLEQILSQQRDELDPRTVMVIERNLATIDEAIRQARAALDGDPANPFLNSHLAEARRRKLDLLRQATTLNEAGN